MTVIKASRSSIVLLISFIALISPRVSAQFVNFGPAKDFVELDIHALVGGSGVFQNYMKNFPQIKELNTTAGTTYGIGAGAVFGISDFFGFGTEANFTINGYNLDFAIINDDVTSISNVFLRNRYLYADIPVFMSFRFNLFNSIRWHVDLGFYYKYGLLGKQKQTIYNSTLNELGQLVPQTVYIRPSYFKSSDTFINSFYRSDIGLHFATGLRFGNHINIGIRLGIGFKNISYTNGLINPRLNNYSILALAGYQF